MRIAALRVLSFVLLTRAEAGIAENPVQRPWETAFGLQNPVDQNTNGNTVARGPENMTVNIDSIGLDFFPPVCKQMSEVFVTPPRIMLADDHTILLEAFRKLLEPRFEIVGMVSDGRALLEAAPNLKPDVIVVDVGMPLMNGLEAGLRLKEMMPSVKIIFLTMNDDPDLAVNAMRSGASGYLLKRSAAAELIHAIHLSLKGKSYVTPQIARGMEKAFINNPNPKDRAKALTPRQREVVQLLAEGKSMKEVASVLNVTPRTVAFHKYRVMEELNLHSTAELVQFAMKSRILVT
jgi:DNA-binding NarL/FixJ family response regulator